MRDMWTYQALMQLCSAMSPALNGSAALQRFKCGNAVEIHNGIMFDFYPGLPHMELRNSIFKLGKELTLLAL